MGFKTFLYKLILKSAISFEEDSYNLYADAANRAESDESRALLLNLADAERTHKEKLVGLLDASGDVTIEAEQEVESNQLELPKLDSSMLGSGASADILEYALQREIHSMAFYLTLAKRTPIAAARETFKYLAGEEKAHKEVLEREMKKLSGKNNS